MRCAPALVAATTLTLLSACEKQGGEPASAPSAPSASASAAAAPAPAPAPAAAPAAALAPATPGLSVGDTAPDVELLTVEGKPVRLASLYKDGPVVLTFYRGGWCPYCTRALAAWQPKLGELAAAGGTFVALTPEKPDSAAATIAKDSLTTTVLSDTSHEAAKAFKVHFVVDEETKVRYTNFGLKVGENNASGTWELPAPATFVIDKDGVIRWVFADWDYKKRADPDEVIAAVKNITGKQ